MPAPVHLALTRTISGEIALLSALYCTHMHARMYSSLSFVHRPKHSPLFYLEILLDDEGVHYTTDLEQFERKLVVVFDHGINVTHVVPQIEKVSL